MSEFKAKGQKHHSNKAKYKDKSKLPKAKEYSKEIPVQTLSKNWDRYEEPEDFSDDYISSKDFNLLAEAPITKPNYFQFKKDKAFLPTENTKLQVEDIFQLNLDILKLGISTIPFYERLNIDKGLFKEQEIDEMHTTAENNKKIYENYLKQREKPDANIGDQNRNVGTDETQIKHNLEEILPEIEDLDLNQLTTNSIVKDKVAEELEDWLDNILD